MKELRTILLEGHYTCVARRGNDLYTSQKRGIQPLLEPLNQDSNFFKGCEVADRVIGKSAALLLVKGEIRSLHAEVISEPALAVLQRYGIPTQYETKVARIVNRTQDGLCPMESAVMETEDPEVAFELLNRKVQEMAEH